MTRRSRPLHLALAALLAAGALAACSRQEAPKPAKPEPTPLRRELPKFNAAGFTKIFDGKSLDLPEASGWAVRRDGGAFDQFTGATITPRAVVEAVRAALEYHERHREALYSAPAHAAGES